MSLKIALRKVFGRLLGSSGYQVLAYHLRKLSGMEPEDLFLSNPPEFYRVLSDLLGQGADFFIEALLKTLALEVGSLSFDAAEAVEELKKGKLDKINRILSRLEEVVRG